ncbi:bifunctional 23S rRNA (guanine(2069)-N(7))-methyltransferase RlmK/23S rRNA (guanine(2445)-N(2))-methyltransferase RlmL, partial [Gammaproteobacteria bacterium]|nr:bifunctional 23S rRNA (guanine(2069)-N(7))-methyltransferase RlmK/23S rRNA (guanine(2445)-N(2))-methyltransferase RlmL [Gammaproteobacteria bacterium]
YAEDVDNDENSISLYREYGKKLKQEFPGWQAGIFTFNPELARHLNIRAQKKYKFQHNKQAAQLMLFNIDEQSFYTRDAETDKTVEVKLSDGAIMFANRIKKNKKQLTKWLRKKQISCYRLYDADMPEYAVAIDIYTSCTGEGYAHVQEYAAPKKVEPHRAKQRFEEIQSALPSALEIPAANIAYKERRQQKGKAQYESRGTDKKNIYIEVMEGKAKLLINLHDYLDVGLFLDHRPVRMEIAALANNKRFLNLFCYTASASVHAALAGASASLSVDMSNTYLDWAKKNFALNNLNTNNHQLLHADCFQWLKNASEKFDLIMLDPPSFSNSKRMESILDIQRDHVGLIKLAMKLLNKEGILIFSTNLRSFTLDIDNLDNFEVENVSAETLDQDFQRNQKIHQCWLISAYNE